MRIEHILCALAIAFTTIASPPVHAAEAFPTKPIQLVIPFAPGDTDTMLRPFTDRLQEVMGQPVVMNYRPGAGGGVGAGSVATAKADGYTIVGSSPGSLVVVPLANKEVKYTADAFQPIAALSEGGLMLVVPAASPYKNIRDLVEAAKKAPGTITFTSSGALGITHLLAEIFSQEAGIKLMHIPYSGSAPAITALLGGHVDMASTAIAPAQAHIKAGTLRPLAVFGEQRLKAYPDVPTLRELGYKLGSPTYYGILAPKDTPREIVDSIYAAIRVVVDKHGAEIGQALAVSGAEIKVLGPDDYGAYLKSQSHLFSAGIKTLAN